MVTLQTFGLKFQVVEAALLSRIQRLERRLMDLEPRVSMEHSEYFFYYFMLFFCFLSWILIVELYLVVHLLCPKPETLENVRSCLDLRNCSFLHVF